MATLFELRAELEDGTTLDVVADQRDVAKFEVQDFGCSAVELSSRMATAYRYMAWSALTRRGQLPTEDGKRQLTWPEWDAKCVEVIDLPDDEESEAKARADAEDPGQPAPSEVSSSRSRGSRASH